MGAKQKQDTELLDAATTGYAAADPAISTPSSPLSCLPQQSLHWQSLVHREGDLLLRDRNELLEIFQEDLERIESSVREDEEYTKRILAIWSCILGYCEALSTNKDASKRYDIFPIPISAVKRLVKDEFVPILESAVQPIDIKAPCTSLTQAQDRHRQRVQAISNIIWQQTLPKTNVRDELHANSVYTVIRGKEIDMKSLDCFGAAVSTIAGLQFLHGDDYNFYAKSFLTLSEDHAYERHQIFKVDVEHPDPPPPQVQEGTCEVAIPGSTNLAKSKRGRDISFALENDGKKCKYPFDPETAWQESRRL
ncbi:MAG: hypothetical protein SGILL_009777 [Bacillariaceae sp.]